MSQFNVPTREEVSANNQAIFDDLKSKLGFVPNLYATYALSNTALGDYLAFQGRKTSLKAKEKEVVNLVVSQINECAYCLAAHTAIAKMNGFTEEQILDIRSGEVNFDDKIKALESFVRDTAINKGKPNQNSVEAFFNAGYTKENLVDTLVVIGDKTISNYLHGVTQIPIDFPEAKSLDLVQA